jgi:hypothetical protein
MSAEKSVFGEVCLELLLNLTCGEVTEESGRTGESELIELRT